MNYLEELFKNTHGLGTIMYVCDSTGKYCTGYSSMYEDILKKDTKSGHIVNGLVVGNDSWFAVKNKHGWGIHFNCRFPKFRESDLLPPTILITEEPMTILEAHSGCDIDVLRRLAYQHGIDLKDMKMIATDDTLYGREVDAELLDKLVYNKILYKNLNIHYNVTIWSETWYINITKDYMRCYERYMTRFPEYEYPLRSLFTWDTPKMATEVNDKYRSETTLRRGLSLILERHGKSVDDVLVILDVDGRFRDSKWDKLDKPAPVGVVIFIGVDFILKCRGGLFTYDRTEPLVHKKESETPSHYKGTHEPIEVMKEWLTDDQYMGFCLGNAIKYIARYDKKGTPVEDINKAIVYLEWAKTHMESQK